MIAFGRGGARRDRASARRAARYGRPRDRASSSTRRRREALVGAVRRFEAAEPFFDAKLIRSHAERFSAARFRDEFLREVQATLDERALDAGTGAG